MNGFSLNLPAAAMAMLVLVACATSSPGQNPAARIPAMPTSPTVVAIESATDKSDTTRAAPNELSEDLARTDEQGAIVIKVIPLNYSNPGKTLDFDVSMNTHSVDLNMDLTGLATLTTDAGKEVNAVKWEAPAGGHHVTGRLVFPAILDTRPFLEGASRMTLSLRNVHAPERVFSWNLH